MQDKIMNAFAEQTRNLYAPLRKLNSLLVENMEKMTQFQLETLKTYGKTGFDQIKQANEVKDVDTMREFTSAQAELMTSLSKKILEDAKTLADMSMEFKTEVEGLLEDARNEALGKQQANKTAEKPAAKSAAK